MDVVASPHAVRLGWLLPPGGLPVGRRQTRREGGERHNSEVHKTSGEGRRHAGCTVAHDIRPSGQIELSRLSRPQHHHLAEHPRRRFPIPPPITGQQGRALGTAQIVRSDDKGRQQAFNQGRPQHRLPAETHRLPSRSRPPAGPGTNAAGWQPARQSPDPVHTHQSRRNPHTAGRFGGSGCPTH